MISCCTTTGTQVATSTAMDDVWEFCHRNWWNQVLIPMGLTTLEQVFGYIGKCRREEIVKFWSRSHMCL